MQKGFRGLGQGLDLSLLGPGHSKTDNTFGT